MWSHSARRIAITPGRPRVHRAQRLEERRSVDHHQLVRAVYRVEDAACLGGLNEVDGDREFPPDHEGSAKAALIGIDQSMVGWAGARSAGRIPGEQAACFIEELHRLSGALEELIPEARVFVRTGFDEPDEVRRLEAVDWS